MKISQLNLLQFQLFLDRRPLSELGTVAAGRKVNSVIEELGKAIKQYRDEYIKLETDWHKLSSPYKAEADKIPPVDDARAEKLAKIDAKAAKDKELQSAYQAWQNFKKDNDDKEIDFAIKDREALSTVKGIFDTQALKYNGWANKNTVFAIDDLLNQS